MKDRLTRKDLIEKTGAPFYVISYLRDLQWLPVARKSSGRGVPNLYFPEAVDVVKSYMERHNSNETGSGRDYR